jgi:hypothetical protein
MFEDLFCFSTFMQKYANRSLIKMRKRRHINMEVGSVVGGGGGKGVGRGKEATTECHLALIFIPYKN